MSASRQTKFRSAVFVWLRFGFRSRLSERVTARLARSNGFPGPVTASSILGNAFLHPSDAFQSVSDAFCIPSDACSHSVRCLFQGVRRLFIPCPTPFAGRPTPSRPRPTPFQLRPTVDAFQKASDAPESRRTLSKRRRTPSQKAPDVFQKARSAPEKPRTIRRKLPTVQGKPPTRQRRRPTLQESLTMDVGKLPPDPPKPTTSHPARSTRKKQPPPCSVESWLLQIRYHRQRTLRVGVAFARDLFEYCQRAPGKGERLGLFRLGLTPLRLRFQAMGEIVAT